MLAEAGEGIGNFLAQGLDRLGDKLGPLLWQFMPTKRFERDDFARFLDLLPDRFQHVLEPRHESFADAAFVELARERGMAIAYSDGDEYPLFDEDTAPFRYARLRRARKGSRPGTRPPISIATPIWRAAGQRKGATSWIFFISGAKVRNPAAAKALIARLG